MVCFSTFMNFQKMNPCLRHWAAVTLFFFAAQQRAIAAPAARVDYPPATSVRTNKSPAALLESAAALDELSLPKSSGPKDLWAALQNPAEKIIVFLQEAHGNISCQKNMATALSILSKHAALTQPWIAFEGTAPGELDHRPLSTFPNAKVRALAAKFFIRSGELDGADLFTARNNPQARHFGADSLDLVLETVQHYRRLLALRPEAEANLNVWNSLLKQLKEKTYSSDLFLLDRLAGLSNTAPADFPQLIAHLRELSKRHGVPLETFRSFQLLLELQQLETKKGKPDMDQARDKALWADLKTVALKSDLDRLVITLEDKVADFKELRDVIALNRAVRFYRALISLTITPEDYERYQAKRENYRLDLIEQKLKTYRAFLKSAHGPSAVPLSSKLTQAVSSALAFYTAVEKRDDVLFRNIQQLASESPSGKLFFIGGGFHRPALTKRLRDAGLAYAVITPRITRKGGEENYWRLLAGTPAPQPLKFGFLSATHLKLSKPWSLPAFPTRVASVLNGLSTPQSPGRLAWRFNAARTLTDFYPLLSTARSEVRSHPDRTGKSSRSISLPLDGSDAEKIRTFLLAVVGTLNELSGDTPIFNSGALHTHLEILSRQITSDAPDVSRSLITQIGEKRLEITLDETLKNDVTIREASDHSAFRLKINPAFFTDFREENPAFPEILLALHIHHQFMRPLIKQQHPGARAAEVSVLASALFGLEQSSGSAPTHAAALITQKVIPHFKAAVEKFTKSRADGKSPDSTIDAKFAGKILAPLGGASISLPLGSTEGSATSSTLPLPALERNAAKNAADVKWLIDFLSDPKTTRIGQGAFGEVFEGPNPESPIQRMAVKIFKPNGPRFQPIQARRILRERDAVSIMNQHNAPHMIGFKEFEFPIAGPPENVLQALNFSATQSPFVELKIIAMEWAQGKPLHEAVDGRPEKTWRRVALELGTVIENMHDLGNRADQARGIAGLLHRDLKPTNIFYDENARTPEKRVILLDFGLVRLLGSSQMQTIDTPSSSSATEPVEAPTPAAKLTDPFADLDAFEKTVIRTLGRVDELDALSAEMPGRAPDRESRDADTGLTNAGQILGTPNYIGSLLGHPEQLARDLQGPGYDMFALGAILYELATKKVPAKTVKDKPGTDVIAIISANSHGRYQNPRDVASGISPARQYIILKLMANLQHNMPQELTQTLLENEHITKRFDANWQPLMRYQDMHEAMRDIEALAAGKPLPSAPSRFLFFANRFKNYAIHTATADQPAQRKRASALKMASSALLVTTTAGVLAALTAGLFWLAQLIQSLTTPAEKLPVEKNPPVVVTPQEEKPKGPEQEPAPTFVWPSEELFLSHLKAYQNGKEKDEVTGVETIRMRPAAKAIREYNVVNLEPNPAEGLTESLTSFVRPNANTDERGFFLVRYLAVDTPIPFAPENRIEFSTKLRISDRGTGGVGAGNIMLGFHNFATHTMEAMIEINAYNKTQNAVTLTYAPRFPMNLDGGADPEIRTAYTQAKQDAKRLDDRPVNPLLQGPAVPFREWLDLRVVKPAAETLKPGETGPNGAKYDGKTALLFFGKNEAPLHEFQIEPGSLHLTLYTSGESSIAIGKPDVTVTFPDKTKTEAVRSELRRITAPAPSPEWAASFTRNFLTASQNALLLIEYDPATFDPLAKRLFHPETHLPLTDTAILIVAPRGAAYRQLRAQVQEKQLRLYHAGIAETSAPLTQMTPQTPEFGNLMRQAERLFGRSLGRPVILGSQEAALSVRLTPETQLVYYRIDQHLFFDPTRLAYGDAILLSASSLSRNYSLMAGIQQNADGSVSLAAGFLHFVEQNYENIHSLALSA